MAGQKKKKSGDIIQKRQSHGRRVDQMWKVKVKKKGKVKKEMSFSYPGFSPTRPYGATGRRENLRTRLRRFEERNCSKLNWTNKRQLNYYKNKDMFRTRLNARLAIRQRAVSFEANISAIMLSIVFNSSLSLPSHINLNSNFRSRYSIPFQCSSGTKEG